MEKGSELSAKLMKIDIHPILRDTLVSQQADIFFLRKQLMEQSQLIENIIDNLAVLVDANTAMLEKYKKIINKNGRALKHDEENDE